MALPTTLPPDTAARRPAPHPDEVLPLVTGDQLGEIALVRRLGSGSTGEVWEGRDPRGGPVAVKVLKSADGLALAGLKGELRALEGVHHRNLVPPSELAFDRGRWYVVSELVHGVPLDRWVDAVPADERVDAVMRALAQLCEAVAHLHGCGVAHLDLSPANVLVREDGQLAVVDFGLARPLWDEGAAAHRASGTPGYVAPEVWRGAGFGPEADWFAVGALLYRMLAGRAPYGGRDAAAIREATLAGPPERPRLEAAAEGLLELAYALLQPDPARRAGAEAIRRSTGSRAQGAVGPAPTPFVGRGQERALLADAWLAARRARTFVQVRGPSGVGKSRLLAELLAGRRASGTPTLVNTCRASERIPHAALDGLLDALVRAAARDGKDWRAELGDDAEVLGRTFASLAITGRPGAVDDPVEERVELAGAVARLLARFAGDEPLLVVLDDVQWADEDSLRLLAVALDQLAGMRAAGVLLLVAGRDPGEDGAAVPAGFEGVPWRTLALGPLTEIEARAIARAVAPVGTPEEVLAVHVSAAQGNPFVLETIAAAGGGQSGRASLVNAVRARAELLGAEAVAALERLCVASTPLPVDLALAGAPQGTLRALLATRLVTYVERGGGRLVEPYHAQIRAAILDGLAPARLRDLHRALLLALQAHGADVGVLAEHAWGAGDAEAAGRWAAAAAEAAEAGLAFHRAALAWREAAERGAWERETRSALFARAARAMLLSGRGAESGEIYATLAAAAPADRAAEYRERAVDAYLVAGAVEPGISALRGAMRELGLPPLRTGVAAFFDAFACLAAAALRRPAPAREPTALEARRIDLCWSAGRGLMVVAPETCIPLFLRSLLLAERAGDRARAGRVAALLGLFFQQFPGARPFGRRLARRAREHADPYLQASCAMWDAYSAYYRADYDSAHASASAALALLEGPCPGLPWETARAREVLLLAAWMRGDLPLVAQLAPLALREAQARGDLQAQAIAQEECARVALLRGDSAGARARAAWIGNWLPGRYTVTHFFGTALESLCDVYDGRPEDALGRLERDRPRFRAAGGHRIPLWRVDWLIAEARLRLAQPDPAPHVPAVRRIARQLRAETRADAPGHAAWIELAVARLRGQAVDGGHVVEAFRTSGVHHFAWTLAAAMGDPTALDRLARAGAADPARWAQLLTPLPGGSSGRP